jgi:hypothetical protein
MIRALFSRSADIGFTAIDSLQMAHTPERVANSLGSAIEWWKGNDRSVSLFFITFFGILLLVRGLSALLR